MSYVADDMTVLLEIYTAVVMVASSNTSRARGCVLRVMGGSYGVVLYVCKDEGNAFADSEIWYVLIWMFEEQEMWLVNASGRNKYNTQHDENKQVSLHDVLAKTHHLGEGRSADERALLVEQYLEQEVQKGDDHVWMLMIGELRLENGNSAILARANSARSTADYEGCEESVLAQLDASRPMGFKAWLALNENVEPEVMSVRTLRSTTLSGRD